MLIKTDPKATYDLASHFHPILGWVNPVMREINFLLGREFLLGNRFSTFACWEKRLFFFLQMFLKTLDSWRFYKMSFKIKLLIIYHTLGRWRPL